MPEKLNRYFNAEDINQIAIGAFAVAVPISFSEEAWNLGKTLPNINLLLVFLLSIAFLAIYTFQNVFQGQIKFRASAFFLRIAIAYGITLLIVSLLLIALDKLPLFSDTVMAIKRLVVIAMPASMGAIIVDGFDKE
jgi:uncharacterized membrane protein